MRYLGHFHEVIKGAPLPPMPVYKCSEMELVKLGVGISCGPYIRVYYNKIAHRSYIYRFIPTAEDSAIGYAGPFEVMFEGRPIDRFRNLGIKVDYK